jgi:hypothetical protein
MTQPTMGRRGAPSSARRPDAFRSTSSSSGRPVRGRRRSGSSSPSAPRAPRQPSPLDIALAEALERDYPEITSFAELGLPPLLVEALRRRGLLAPFAIQTRALPDALAGRDVLGRAATGSGKTLAFGLPMLTRLAGGRPELAGPHRGVDGGLGPAPARAARSPRARPRSPPASWRSRSPAPWRPWPTRSACGSPASWAGRPTAARSTR